MRNGLYKVEFKTPLGWGSGVIHLAEDRIWGGDAALYYVGTFKKLGEQIIAEVTTNRHTSYPGQDIVSVFGKDKVHIVLRGTAKGESMHLEGSAAEAPGVGFIANLTFISD